MAKAVSKLNAKLVIQRYFLSIQRAGKQTLPSNKWVKGYKRTKALQLCISGLENCSYCSKIAKIIRLLKQRCTRLQSSQEDHRGFSFKKAVLKSVALLLNSSESAIQKNGLSDGWGSKTQDRNWDGRKKNLISLVCISLGYLFFCSAVGWSCTGSMHVALSIPGKNLKNTKKRNLKILWESSTKWTLTMIRSHLLSSRPNVLNLVPERYNYFCGQLNFDISL